MHKLNSLKYQCIGVDIHINNVNNNPKCEHGPSVLFERKLHNGEKKKFYACSACRDRKLCAFYSENIMESDKDDASPKELQKYTEHILNHKRFLRTQKKNLGISYCISCSDIVIGKKVENHSDCKIEKNISKTKLQFPTQILSPKSNPKFEAQYLFTENSLQVIINTLKNLSNEKILCIGAPRVHEDIRSNDYGMKSILLDIDDRYCSFFSEEEFMVYNIFNHHFFGGINSKQHFLKFITGPEKIILITDPPFGGRMELLANTIKLIEDEWREVNQLPQDEILPVIFIFPYFLEKSVKVHLPTYSMLEYRVDYDNHALYTTGPKGMKRGSAVRMFTNLPEDAFPFPEEEGYRFCKPCNKWVHPKNAHCLKCESCTSKDGTTYKHCDVCRICVKPVWVHCSTCDRCLPQDHKCNPKEHHDPQKEDLKRKGPFSAAYPKSKRKFRDSHPHSTGKPKHKKPLPRNKGEEKQRDLQVLQQMFNK